PSASYSKGTCITRGGGNPSMRARTRCRAVESSRSAPRTISVMPCRPSSTTTTNWYAQRPSARRRMKSPTSFSTFWHCSPIRQSTVHCRHEGVCTEAVGPAQNESSHFLFNILALFAHPAVDEVFGTGLALRYTQPPRAGDLPHGQAVTAGAGVRSACQHAAGTCAAVNPPGLPQALERLLVQGQSLRLPDGCFIPMHVQGPKLLHDGRVGAAHHTGRINVFDTQQRLDAVRSSVQEARHGGQQRSVMQRPAGAGGKAPTIRGGARVHARTAFGCCRLVRDCGTFAVQKLFKKQVINL